MSGIPIVVTMLLLTVFVTGSANSRTNVKYVQITAPESVKDVRLDGNAVIVEGANGRQWRFLSISTNPRFERIPDRQPPAKPANGLPDGIITTSPDGQYTGWLTGPTTRYDHGVLGDDIEASGITIRTREGIEYQHELPSDYVFEDRQVRFHDLNADREPEVIVIKSGFDGGARISAYEIRAGNIHLVAESRAIGRAYRWLNLIGVADFDGDSKQEIAAVITPHLGVVLRLFRLEGNNLKVVNEASGFSNHGIGMRSMGLAAIADVDGDGIKDLIVPDASRTSIRIVTFANKHFSELYRIPLRTSISGNMMLMAGKNGYSVIFPQSDGRLGAILIENP
jgi:hypothetical protein